MLMHEKIVTQEDIDRGWIFFGDRRMVVIHAKVGDLVRAYMAEPTNPQETDND